MAITVPKTDEEYINKMYDAKKESTLRTLQSAYDKNVAAVDSALSGIGTSAYEAKRQAAGDAAITRQRLNEQFAANGLNTGAVGQANLALLNQKAANLNAIELKRVEAENQYNAQKAALTQEYQNQVKNAILENDAGRAEALYKAWKEQQAALASGGSGRSSSSSGYGGSGGDGVWSGDDEDNDENSTSSVISKGLGAKLNLTALDKNQGEIGGSYYKTASNNIKGMERTVAQKYLRDLRDNSYITDGEYQVLVKEARR